MDKKIVLEEQYDKIYRYCYFKVGHRETAEDITQETFLRFLDGKNRLRAGNPLAFLYTVARNLCMDEYRRKKWDSLPEELPEGKNMEEEMLTSHVIKKALEELDGEVRELILLKYVNEVPVSVICKMFGMSRFMVYRRIKEGLAILKEKVGEI